MVRYLFGAFLALAGVHASTAKALITKSKKNLKVASVNYGDSFAGEKLVGHSLMFSGNFSNRRVVLVTGGIHGNEYLGIAQGIFDQTSSGNLSLEFLKFFEKGGILLVAPKVNPDGIKLGKRHSLLGKDLNRDFNHESPDEFLQQQESHGLAKWVESELQKYNGQLILAMDYHCCAKSLIHPNFSLEKEQVLYQKITTEIVSSLREVVGADYRLGETKDIFGRTTAGTLKEFWFKKYGTISYTFEGDDPSENASRTAMHMKWWGKILVSINNVSRMEARLLAKGDNSLPISNESTLERKAYSE